MKKKLLLIIAGVLLLFIITNPSITAFKAYRGRDSYDGLKRPLNLFVYSVYKDHGAEFIGLFENFIRVNQHPITETPVASNQAMIDSAKMTDTSKDPFAKYGGHEIKASK